MSTESTQKAGAVHARASADVLADARLALDLFAIAPHALGGVILRAGASPQRDAIVLRVRESLPANTPFLRVPLHITEDRLLGGLSLAATLETGHVVMERGLLAQAHEGVAVVAMAERLTGSVTSHLCAAVERGVVALERDGMTASVDCRIGVLALDEGIEDEQVPLALRDRLAFWLDLSAVEPRANVLDGADTDASRSANLIRARASLADVTIDEEIVVALTHAAVALGIASARGPIFAAIAARAHAALCGRSAVDEEDASAAARLVLSARATQQPMMVAEEDASSPPDSTPPDTAPEQPQEPRDQNERDDDERDEQTKKPPTAPERPLDDVVIAAAKSAIPDGLLDALAIGREARSSAKSKGRAGAARASSQGGRPAGVRAKAPSHGERLNVVETLRAAAPWQRLRLRDETPLHGRALQTRCLVRVRKEDFRVTRFVERAETSVIFSVDASGSAAMARLAEAKGAVEQVLADCYVRRDHVALIAFRGATSTLLLPSTRSLARVRKCLADLAGGGGTPLASGLDAARALAIDAKKSGKTPIIVLMTDGRANVARDGSEGSAGASVDALDSARMLRITGIRSLFLDTSPRPRPQARRLAREMGATYLPLPHLDAAGISRHVRALAEDAA